jgi:hypothetical protein
MARSLLWVTVHQASRGESVCASLGNESIPKRGYNPAVIDPGLRDRVMEAIWGKRGASGTSVWAILDCARDERIYPALRTSGLDFLCLYSGRLSPAVEAAAPYLIELAPQFKFTPKLIEMGWGRSWGVFLRVTDASNLRPHLRRFLRVRDDAGRVLLFRYYDPRVLRVYLPTCHNDELRTVFGPIHSYMLESADGDSLIEFAFDGSQLHERRTELYPADARGEPPAVGSSA